MYPPHHLGGYELLCQDIVERWRARGHHVEVLTTTYRRPRATDEPATSDVRIRRLLHFYWDDHRILTPPLLTRLRMERANQRALTEALLEHRPDVVSVWHMGAMSFGLLQTIAERRVPMVLVVGDDWLVYGPAVDAWTQLFAGRPRLGRVVRRLTGVPTSFAPQSDELVVCFASDWLRRRALEQSPFTLRRTTVAYHGIDPARFRAPAESSHPWTWRLLCAGRIEERKGVHVAIEALAHLPDAATLDVVGPGDDGYLERLRRTAERLGVAARVRFVGPVARDDLRERYRSADAFLFPVVWEEPFGLVPLEAMASETPVVATGTGGSGEFLLDGVNCLLVPRGDAQALADAVRRLAEDGAVRQALVRAGRATVEHLGVDRLADALDAWNEAARARFRNAVPADPPPIREAVAPSASGPDRDA